MMGERRVDQAPLFYEFSLDRHGHVGADADGDDVSPDPRLAAVTSALVRITAALARTGVIFIDENGQGLGVRLRKGL